MPWGSTSEEETAKWCEGCRCFLKDFGNPKFVTISYNFMVYIILFILIYI